MGKTNGIIETPEKKRYTWAEDAAEEIWLNGEFGSVEECIKEAKANGHATGDTIYIGECETVELGGIDLSSVLEYVEEDMYCQVGEVAEGWNISSITKDRRAIYEVYEERLAKLVEDYINEIGEKPSFCRIVGVGPVEIK